MYSIEFTRDASKALAKLPVDLKSLIIKKIKEVAEAPYEQHNNVKRLQGCPEFRLRVHDWRVIYRVQDDRVVLLVIKIASRGEVYK